MGTQVVRHTSRGVDITLNFASTENNLSWSFTQEGDGEIYEVSLTNVASYTIAGGTVTLPYVVTNGSSYAVSIVKTTTGQTASITFKTRRATNKTQTASVPDFGAHSGRYLYVLKGNNTVEKYDTALLTASNYVGDGVWTVTPLLSTITLPTNPDGSIYQAMCFTKYGGEERLCCFARITTTGTTACYACYVRLSDNIVLDLTMTTQNTPTNILTNQIHTSVLNAIYDYINEQILLTFTGASTAGYSLNLNTNINSLSDKYKLGISNTKSTNYIVPTINSLASTGLIDLTTSKTKAWIPFNNTAGWAYISSLNRVVTGSFSSQFESWSLDASTSTSYAVTNGSPSAHTILTKLFNNNNNLYFGCGTTNTYVSWYQIGTGKNQNFQAVQKASGQTGFYNACFTKYNSNFFALGNTSLGRRRVTVFELDITNQTTTEMYFDFIDSDGNQICCNQLFY